MLKFPLPRLSRQAVGSILFLAAVFAALGATLFESFGFSAAHGLKPLSFVGALVAVKLGLFAFWPELKALGEKGVASSGLLPDLFSAQDAKERPTSRLTLWNEHDPRVDIALFSANVPTFILSQEQRIIDWNPAFDLVFGQAQGMRRGAHVSGWFALLDNFKKLPKRTGKLYGEGVLPLTDRERATYLSPRFGRMVFTKIMAPLIDRKTGRIIGWSVVLNINSVNRREVFLAELFKTVAEETQKLRYAVAYDGLFDHYGPRAYLMQLHALPFRGGMRILDLGAGSGALSRKLLDLGCRVTAVEGDTHLLRQAREGLAARGAKLVRQDLDQLRNLPDQRFDGSAMMLKLHQVDDPATLLLKLRDALKPGATLTLSVRLKGSSVQELFESLRNELTSKGRMDPLKHQFSHVLAREEELAKRSKPLSREGVRALVLEASFNIEAEHEHLEDGHSLLIIARKDA